MSELQKINLLAQYWTSYQNVLKMLRTRGYLIPDHLCKTFAEYRQLYDQCFDEQLVLHPISFIVSKDVRKPLTHDFVLPNINHCIGTLLELHEDSEGQCLQICNETLARDVLKIQDLEIVRCEPHEVVVLFCRKWNGALGIEPIMQLLKYQMLLRCMHLILIINNENDPENVLTSLPCKLLQTRRYPEHTASGAIVEWFSLLQTASDITKTVYHTRFEKYAPERAAQWLKQHNLRAEQLETIRVTDPIALYHDHRVGDFIEIHDYDCTSSHVIIGTDK
jgi:DNA-directed RNA polymerase subunit H (RpoH/RPB5)